MTQMVHSLGLSILIAMCFSCSTTQMTLKGDPAERLYQQAQTDLKDSLYPEAIKGFKRIKAKYPYSQWARLASLRIADTHFDQGQYDEAVDAYRRFIRYNPLHSEVPYASLRVGDAYFERIPTNWWFLPPSAEKDQSYVKLAIEAYNNVIRVHPKSPHVETAKTKQRVSRTKLAEHELYVARFYFERNRAKAALARAEGLLQNYPQLGSDALALSIAAHAKLALGDSDAAIVLFEQIRGRFPSTEQAEDASKQLDTLGMITSKLQNVEGEATSPLKQPAPPE